MEKINNMDAIDAMQGKAVDVEIMGVKLSLEQLDLDQLAKFSQLQEQKDLQASMKFAIKETLLNSNIPENKILKLRPEFILQLLPKILEINGLLGDVSKKVPNPQASKSELPLNGVQ